MRHRRVLFVLPNLQVGGAERVVITILPVLKKRGWDVDLLLFKNKRDYDITSLKNKNISIFSIFNNHQKISRHPVKFFKKLLSFLKNYDILVGGLELWPSYITVWAGKLLGKKTIVINHTFLSKYLQISNFSKIHIFLSKLFIPRSDAIISVSEGAKNDLVNNFRVNPRKIKVVYNPIDFFNITERTREPIPEAELKIYKKPVVISIGRLSRQKGLDILLGAFKIIVIDKKMEVNLIILGEGEEEKNLKGLAQQLGISENVYFLGFKENPFKYAAKSTIFVSPSRVEGFSLVIAEALACGCPVISTDCLSGPSEILKGEKYGKLVKVENKQELGDALLELLLDQNKQMELKKMGLKEPRNLIKRI